MLNRMLAHLEYRDAPQYTIFCHTRPFGMTNYVASVFIPPHPIEPMEDQLTFSGHDESYSGAVQAAAFNAICSLRYLYPDLTDSPFCYYIGQDSFTQPIYQNETLLEQNDALLETSHMLHVTHSLYRSAAYDRDLYHRRLSCALEYLHRYVDPRHLPPGLMAANGDYPWPQHENRPYVLQFGNITGPRYNSRHQVATATPGTYRRRREPNPSEVPVIFSRPARLPSAFQLHDALYRDWEEELLERDDMH